MARQRIIAAIGEAMLRDSPHGAEIAGFAALCAVHAARAGQVGLLITRVGQDRWGDELLAQLRAAGVNVEHVQSDPDLPTGRVGARVGGRTSGRAPAGRAAFDNLQWDFDMLDVAQQADIALFGALARRDGQTRSVIKQFLAECASALRWFDLTSRADDAIDRAAARTGLEFADGLVTDANGLAAILPAAAARDARQAALEVLRSRELSYVAAIEQKSAGEFLSLHTIEQQFSAADGYPAETHEAMVVGLAHDLVSGASGQRAIEAAVKAANRTAAGQSESAA